MDNVTVANKRQSNLGGIDGTGGKGVERGHVSVFTLHRLFCGRAIVDAAYHFGSHQRTWTGHKTKELTQNLRLFMKTQGSHSFSLTKKPTKQTPATYTW